MVPDEETAAEVAKVKETFQRYNPKGDAISYKDLEAILVSLGKGKISEVDVKALFVAMDKNKDQLIQFSEFLDWVMMSRKEKPSEAAKRIRREMGPLGERCVCVLGGKMIRSDHTEALLKALGRHLSDKLAGKAVIVTGGLPGIQRVFADGCGDGTELWHLLPNGEESGYGKGRDIHAGADLQERMEVTGQLGDLYVTAEGGPGVSQEAIAACTRGARVLPLVATGGASGGMFDFPREALQRPACASEQQWALLCDDKAPVEEAAAAAAAIACSLLGL